MTKKPLHGKPEDEAVLTIDDMDDDPLSDWEQSETSGVAVGSQSEALPTSSRTSTLSDPLTTGLLAEVARRTETMEPDPESVEVARRSTQEIDAEALAAALRDSEPTPTPTPNVRRK